MKLTHIVHLGIAVKSLETAIPFYEEVLGLKCYAVEEVAEQKVKTAFFKVGQTKIELLEPTSPDSTIAKFIEKRGEGIHHIAFDVNDSLCEAIQQTLKPKRYLTHIDSVFLDQETAYKITVGILKPEAALL